MATEKPHLLAIDASTRNPDLADDLIAMWEAITGRKATPEEIEEFRAEIRAERDAQPRADDE